MSEKIKLSKRLDCHFVKKFCIENCLKNVPRLRGVRRVEDPGDEVEQLGAEAARLLNALNAQDERN